MNQSACASQNVQGMKQACNSERVNVGSTERWISTIAGGALLAGGVARLNFKGVLGIAAGAAMFYRGLSGHCALYQALGINTAKRNGATVVPAQKGARVEHSIDIAAPRERLYRQWRVLSNLPKFAPHLESVHEIDPAHSHWIAKTPIGGTVEWDAEIIEDRLGELISWRSLPGSVIDSAGSVRFQTLGENDSTLLTLQLKYNPPGGTATARLAEFFNLGMQEEVEEALLKFKHEMETAQAVALGSPRQGDDAYLRP